MGPTVLMEGGWNSQRRREVVAWVRSLPEPDRSTYLRRALSCHSERGLDLVRHCRPSREFLLDTLQRGLDQVDASYIRDRLRAIIPGLGIRRVLAVIRSRVASDPEAVYQALYWLSSLLPAGNEQARAALVDLTADFRRQHPNYQPDQPVNLTEQSWLDSSDPRALLAWVVNTPAATVRRFRLFACACLREGTGVFMADEYVGYAVDLAEHTTDVPMDEERLYQALDLVAAGANGIADGSNALTLARSAAYRVPWPRYKLSDSLPSFREMAWSVADQTARAAAADVREKGGSSTAWGRALKAERALQARLIRCVFGNPFQRPPANDPAWLTWDNGTVARLANAIYDDHHFAYLPVLADALTDAGCTDEGMLGHLRDSGPYARGCHVIDGLSGKK